LVKDNFLSRLFEDCDGYLWCKGRFDDLYRIGYQNGQATDARKFSLSLGALQQFLTDSSNRLLAVFPKRIMRFEKTDETWKDAGLSTESIVGEVDMSSAMLNKQGSLYIGTTGNGVYTFPKGQSVPQSIDFSDKFFQLSESSTTALMEDRSGNVWTGCFRKGVVLLNHQQNAFRSWTFSPTNGSLGNAQISSIAIDDKGCIWCTVWNKGLYRFSDKGEISAAASAGARRPRARPPGVKPRLSGQRRHLLARGRERALQIQPAVGAFAACLGFFRVDQRDSRD